jgi:predicted ABC-type ATPase
VTGGSSHPQVVVIAGPNGAGKTSAAPALLKDTVGIDVFVNADYIAEGLSGFSPQSAAFEAGRLMLDRLKDLVEQRKDFAFESTLSGRTGTRFMRWALEGGYHVHILYLWLPSPELAVARVRGRVAAGGHDVPADVIRRRFKRSLYNFDRYYRLLATTWRLYDSSAVVSAPLVARGAIGEGTTVLDRRRWEAIQEQLEDTT